MTEETIASKCENTGGHYPIEKNGYTKCAKCNVVLEVEE